METTGEVEYLPEFLMVPLGCLLLQTLPLLQLFRAKVRGQRGAAFHIVPTCLVSGKEMP